MYFYICLTILLLGTSSFADNPSESKVYQAFKNDPLVSKIVMNPPSEFMAVTYQDTQINLGTTMQPLETLKEPHYISYEADPDKLYTFMFVGPDVPPSLVVPFTQFMHWLVINVPGKDIAKGDAMAPYFPPVSYPGGFPYMFLLYEQNGAIDTDEISDMSSILSRTQFSIDDFVSKHNLKVKAGNFLHEAYTKVVDQALDTASNVLKSGLDILG